MTTTKRKFWTVAELAKKVNRPYGTVRRWCAIGYVKSEKVERQIAGKKARNYYRIPRDEGMRVIKAIADGALIGA